MDEEHNKQENSNWAEKLFDLFDMEFTTNSKEDVLDSSETSIDFEEFRLKSRRIFRNIVTEFPEDWRNSISAEELARSEKLKQMPLRLDLSILELVAMINETIKKLSEKQKQALFSPSLAYRNLEKHEVKDLALILRDLQFFAIESDIDLESKT
jgi:hypothetical protein